MEKYFKMANKLIAHTQLDTKLEFEKYYKLNTNRLQTRSAELRTIINRLKSTLGSNATDTINFSADP